MRFAVNNEYEGEYIWRVKEIGGKGMPSKVMKRRLFDRSMLEKAPLRDYGFHKIFDPTTEDGKTCIAFLLRSICGMVDAEIEMLLPKRYEGDKGEIKTT